jgi:hypothetical protein
MMSEGDDVEAVGWVIGRVFDVLGALGSALRGRPRFTGVGAEIHVGGVGSLGRRCSWTEYHSTSVGKSPVMSASWNFFLAMW